MLEWSPALLQAKALTVDVAIVTVGRSANEDGDCKVAEDFDLTATEKARQRDVSIAFHAQC